MSSRLHGSGRMGGRTLGVLFAMAALAAAGETRAAATPASSDSSMTLRAGQAGTEFRSMTVEGEDRVHIDFGRPELTLDLDPQNVPGLSRGTALDVLDRTRPELSAPLIALSAKERSPYVAKPWLRRFATGPVARFRPEVTGAAPPTALSWNATSSFLKPLS